MTAKKTATPTLGSSQIATRLKIDAKKLRKILRSQASKANGGARYEFKESGIPKLREMIDEHTRNKETVKAAKTKR